MLVLSDLYRLRRDHCGSDHPQEIPDLFAGSQLILLGRYREGGPAKITLKGKVNLEERSYTYEDTSFRKEGGDDFIPRLRPHGRWAAI